MIFKQETTKEYETIRNEIAEWNGVSRYTNRDGVSELMDRFITGNDFYIDEKDDTYVRLVRNTFSRSRKTRHLIVMEVKKIDDLNYNTFLYYSTHWKKNNILDVNAPYVKFKLDDKPTKLVRYL